MGNAGGVESDGYAGIGLDADGTPGAASALGAKCGCAGGSGCCAWAGVWLIGE